MTSLTGDAMSELYMPIVALITGLIGLVWGADKFVNGSVGVAKNLGISSLVIGLTVVSIGTSAPEIIVSINAALKDSGGLAVGNAIGSNLANIGLVLGVTALVAPIPVKQYLLREESPILLVVTALAGLCLYDSQLDRFESLMLGVLVLPILIFMVKFKKNHQTSLLRQILFQTLFLLENIIMTICAVLFFNQKQNTEGKVGVSDGDRGTFDLSKGNLLTIITVIWICQATAILLRLIYYGLHPASVSMSKLKEKKQVNMMVVS